MLFSGVQKLTLLDFPGRPACILFTPGCNLRCGFCHNPEFVLPERLKEIAGSFIQEEAIFRFLDERKKFLQGVVITGGEPTIARELPAFIRRVKERGFAVKLDTNGTNPETLRALLMEKLLDYVAMDYKTAFAAYSSLVGSPSAGEAVRQSLEILKESEIPHEIRTTMIREVHTEDILEKMRLELTGVKNYFLQDFRPLITLKKEFSTYHGFGESELNRLAHSFRASVAQVGIRA